MIKGEYRGASLGWLVAILVAVGVWAVIWGPTDDDAPVDDDVPADDGEPAPTTTESAPPTTTEAALPDGGIDGPVIRHAGPFDTESNQAEIRGTLVLEDGCLLVSAVYGRFPLVWPAGTAWDAATNTVVLHSGAHIAVGDEIRGAGGYPSAEGVAANHGREAGELASRCAESEYREVASLGNNPSFVEGLGPSTAITAGSVDGPVVGWPLPYSLEGTDAEVGGVLVLRGDCLQFEYGADAEAGYLPIVWPAGTAWDPDRLEVVLPAGDRIGIGATVAGGGGYPYADGFGSFDEDARALLQSCADNEWNEVAAFNNRLGAIEVRPAPPRALDGPVVRQRLPYWTEGEGAAINGPLELNDGCLQLPYGDGEHLAIVWPAGTSWDAVAQEVEVATGERIGIGDVVDGGGGYYRPEDFADLGDEAVEVLSACALNQWREVARFNNLESAARPAG